MEKAVKINENESMVGTSFIADGFGRKHKAITNLIEKYEKDFQTLNEGTPFDVVKLEKSSVGRPVLEYWLNYNQLIFLISIMRGGEEMGVVKRKIISAATVVNAIKLLSSFDLDGINVRFVYAAQDECGRVKIGISNDPERRLKELSAANGGELKLILVREATGPGYSDEVKLHADAGVFRIHSEWFTKEATGVSAWDK